MKTVFKRILAFLLSAAVIAASVALCSVICNHPSEMVENTVDSFYREPEGSLDLVVIGSSAAGTDFFPAVLWKKEKITSYCMFVDGCTADIYASVLKEVLSKQPQAAIAFDIDGFIASDDFKNEQDPTRMWLDSMPRNKNWYETVNALCPDTKWERFFPFSRYHRNMTSLYGLVPISFRLTKKKILKLRDPMKGAYINEAVWDSEMQHLDIKGFEPEKLTDRKEMFFNELLDLCKSNELENVIFVDFPKTYNTEENLSRNRHYAGRSMYIKNKVQSLGYSFFSYNELDNPAELTDSDFANTLHLNKSGGIKFTDYFADYLKDRVPVSEKSETVLNQWESDTAGILNEYNY